MQCARTCGRETPGRLRRRGEIAFPLFYNYVTHILHHFLPLYLHETTINHASELFFRPDLKIGKYQPLTNINFSMCCLYCFLSLLSFQAFDRFSFVGRYKACELTCDQTASPLVWGSPTKAVFKFLNLSKMHIVSLPVDLLKHPPTN